MIFAIIALIAGLIILGFSANYLITSSVRIAKYFKVSNLLIGLTIIAAGTSAPELFLSSMAAINGNGSLSVGNVIGSNIFNLGFILGLSAILIPITIQKKLVYRDGLFLLIITGLIFLMLRDQQVAWREGTILLSALVGYTSYLWGKKEAPMEDENPDILKPRLRNLAYLLGSFIVFSFVHPGSNNGNFSIELGFSLPSFVFLCFLGSLFVLAIFRKDIPKRNPNSNGIILNTIKLFVSLGLLVLASDYVVVAAVYIAQTFGISERAIGATIVAAGTSLPEIAATVAAILKKNHDMGVGNVIGSDIFNILGIIGISSVIAPLHLAPKCLIVTECSSGLSLLLRDNIFSVLILFLTLGITFLLMRTGRKLSKREGIVLFTLALLRMIFEINPNFFVSLF